MLEVGVNVAEAPEQILCVLDALVISGLGFTTAVKVNGVVPVHDDGAGPTGVMVYVTESAVVPELVNKSEILPEPDAVNPVRDAEDEVAVQLNVVPATDEVGVNDAVPDPQIDWLLFVFVTVGFAFIVTTSESILVAHPPPLIVL
jgi:hypothetical protein